MLSINGIIIGAATFLIIGICHPIVIKAEYYWTRHCWWLFLVIGIAFAILSLFLKNFVSSSIAGACAFSFFWGILELFAQEKRVLRGWFPENPAHHDYYEAKRKATSYQLSLKK